MGHINRANDNWINDVLTTRNVMEKDASLTQVSSNTKHCIKLKQYKRKINVMWFMCLIVLILIKVLKTKDKFVICNWFK